MEKGNKKIIKGWIFYDWANSVYNLVITTAIFPIFYANVTESHYLERTGRAGETLPHGENVMVEFLGREISNSVLLSYTLAASFLLVAILSPLLSGIADYMGSKKRFLQFFCYLGAASCASLYFFDPEHIAIGMLSVFLASIGFWHSFVFYNAFLPEIAEPKDHDYISARGFSMGYFGSMILLAISLILIMFVDASLTTFCFILVGLWWAGFAQVTFSRLPNNVYGVKRESKRVIWKGFNEIKNVLKEFRQTRRLKRFLMAFFFFNTGVQTVMLVAVVYAMKEIEWGEDGGDTGLIVAIIIMQVLAAIGAYFMSWLSGKIGNLNTLTIVVFGWMVMCITAYFVTQPNSFYMLASGIGFVMGGVQALSRSTYSKFLPDTKEHASYFSFYDVTEKVGMVLGLFFFGIIEDVTNDIRASVLSIIVFFVIGLLLLFIVPKKERYKNAKFGTEKN